MNRLLIILILIFQFSLAHAQEKYWITFNDKDIHDYQYEQNLSAQTIKNRKRFNLPLFQYTDVPVNKSYIDSLGIYGIKVLAKSKWLNSVSAFLSIEQKEKISKLAFVKEVSLIDRRIQVTGSKFNVQPNYFEPAIKQMQGDIFALKGLTGKGVSIGLLDAGFFNAYRDKYLAHVFSENRIIKQRDFLTPPVVELVRDTLKESDSHGRTVLWHICGYDSLTNLLMGLAPNGQFYLARTENEANESRAEEDNWIMALEWMDSLGVRLINTSLGYAVNMDDPKENYKKEEMDGKTARISKAAQIASDEKGIFVVVSAGNEGRNDWKIISAPADAVGVLSVGATEDRNWMKIDYSSIGPEFINYLKPNVSCFSLSGTSYSAPAVTGFVACLMEKDSTLNNKQLKEIVEKSGHLYPYGNNYIGYGVPQAGKALKMIENRKHEFGNYSEKTVGSKRFTLKLKSGENEAVVFHKKNKTVVIQQETINTKKSKFIIKRNPEAKYTTVVFGLEVLEIVWE